MHTAPPFPKMPQQLRLEHTRLRSGSKIVVMIKRGKNSLAGHYDGDLAITGSVGNYEFEKMPLNEVYTELVLRFVNKCGDALNVESHIVAADSIASLYEHYFELVKAIHDIARRQVCTDPSRLTTAMTFANNCSFTLINFSLLCLEDGRTDEDLQVVIDPNLAGLEKLDSYGVAIPGLDPKHEISKIPRQDLSRNCSYLASRSDEQKVQDNRLDFLLKLVAGEKLPDVRTPNTVFTPIADAWRAQPSSISRVITESATLLREFCLEAELEE